MTTYRSRFREASAALTNLLPLAGLAALVIAAYLAVLRFPFVQDDWGWIARFQTKSPAQVLATIFAIKGTIFFRPLSGLYLYIMYLIFGPHPLPFHIVALASLVASSYFVIEIMRIVTRDEVISIAAGFIYAVSAAVNIEPLLWAVGVNDLGASFFFLLSMLLFLRGRAGWSVVAFCVGCLFKETVFVLPFIVAGYAVIMGHGRGNSWNARAFKGFVAMTIAFCAFVCLKLIGLSPFALASSHPYVIKVLGSHIERNLFLYAAWMSQCFDPFLSSTGAMMKWVLNDLALIFLFSVWLAARTSKPVEAGSVEQGGELGVEPTGSGVEPGATGTEPSGPGVEPERPRGSEARTFLFLLVWMLLALVPILFLPNHTYRYYAIYALPAFIGAILLQVSVWSRSMRLKRVVAHTLVVCIAAAAVILSLLQSRVMFAEGFEQRTLLDGTNGLIRKAAIVELTRASLMRDLPSPPHGAVILIGDAEIGAFNMESGVRAWYGDPSISVYDLSDFVCDETGAHIYTPIESSPDGVGGVKATKTYVDPAKIFAFRMDKTGLRVVNLENMMKRTVPATPDSTPHAPSTPPHARSTAPHR